MKKITVLIPLAVLTYYTARSAWKALNEPREYCSFAGDLDLW